jgi:nucleoid-associated protein YgaU
MGIFDKKEGSIFGDGPSGDTTRTPSNAPRANAPRADFSDVSSGQSTDAPPPSAAAGKVYTVKSGDSLSKIAKAEYGDASKWKRIYEANKDKIKNPDLIYPGQEFTIPDA